MLKDIKKLTKHSSIYSVGNILSRMVGIVLIPLYTQYIALEMFGLYAVFEVTFQFGQSFLLLGLPLALFRWLSLEKEIDKQKEIFTAILFFYFFISVILISVIYILKEKLSYLFFHNYLFSEYFLYVAVIIALLLFNQIITSLLRYENKSIHFVLTQLAKFLLQLGFTIYFVVKLDLSIKGIFLGHIFSNLLVLLMLLPYTIKKLSFHINFKKLKNMVWFGAPLAISDLSSRFLNMGDRYLLGILGDMKAVGIYSIGYKIASTIDSFFLGAFQYSFIPMAWKKLENKNAKNFYTKIFTYLSFLLFGVALSMSLYQKEIMYIFSRNSEYWDVSSVIGIVAFGICFKGMSTVVKMGLQFTKQTKYIALSVFSAAIFNILLNFILIPIFSYIGAAIATILSFIFMLVLSLYFSDKYYPMKFEWNKVFKIIGTVLTIYMISEQLPVISFWFNIFLKFLLILLYPIILYFLKFYDDIEILRIKQSWRKWKNPKNWKKNISHIKFK